MASPMSRRPSKLNVLAAGSTTSLSPGVTDLRRRSSANYGQHQAPPSLSQSTRFAALRLPALFRTRVPVILLVPFFILGWLFAPINRLDDSNPSTRSPSKTTASSPLDSAPEKTGWAQRFLSRSGNKNLDAAAHSLLPHQDYTLQDGLLYFPPAGLDDNGHSTGGVSAARAGQPAQRHPILHLIEQAEKKWEDLLSRQSTTLESAVSEYKRRYKRSPPKGFDKWFEFATKNNIQLIDEYDMINKDIQPFLALPPKVFNARNHKLASDPTFQHSQASFTINIELGKLSITGPLKEMGRAVEISELLDSFAASLPDLKATFTAHDGPGIIISGEGRQRYMDTAREGRTLREDEFDQIHNPAEFPGFTAACPPASHWRNSLSGWDVQKPSTHSFIVDVSESADVCKHPNLASQHGFFLWNGPHMGPLYPLFTWSKTTLHSDILVTPLEQYYLPVGPDPEWENKRYNKLLWRGSNTGAAFTRESRWRSSQRARLVLMTAETTGDKVVHYADEDGLLRASAEPIVDINERYTDVGFSGRPAQCDQGDGTCDALLRVFEWKAGMGQEEANQYKYIFDMDGNGWSGRFHRLLSSNSAILKSTIMPEWYQERIMPWVHFIPVKVDYTDLYDILGFFIGGPNGDEGHDALGKKIALQGKEWAQHHWREEDMQAYMFRLLLEFGRLGARTEDDLLAGDYTSP